MEQNTQPRTSQRGRTFSLVAWALVVVAGVFELVFHPQRAWFLTLLMVLVGIMSIVSEITARLREPQ